MRRPSEQAPLKQDERLTSYEEIQLKRFERIKEYLLMLNPKRPIHFGSHVFTLDPELEYQNLIVVGENDDGTWKVAYKSKPDFPVKNLAEDVLFDAEDFVAANREAWRQYPPMPGETYIGPPWDATHAPMGRE